MVICLKCRAVSSRSALYCGRCGGAFGGARCSAFGHLSPGLTRLTYCPVCRTKDVVQAVPSLNLGFMTRIAAWGLTLCGLKYLLGHLDLVIHVLSALIGWVLGKCLLESIGSTCSLLFVTWLFIRCIGALNPEFARRIDPFPKLVPALWRGGIRLLEWLGRMLFLIVEGKVLPELKKHRRKSREGH